MVASPGSGRGFRTLWVALRPLEVDAVGKVGKVWSVRGDQGGYASRKECPDDHRRVIFFIAPRQSETVRVDCAAEFQL